MVLVVAETVRGLPEGLPFCLPERSEGFVMGRRLVQRVANDIRRRRRHDGDWGGGGDGRVVCRFSAGRGDSAVVSMSEAGAG